LKSFYLYAPWLHTYENETSSRRKLRKSYAKDFFSLFSVFASLIVSKDKKKLKVWKCRYSENNFVVGGLRNITGVMLLA